jgi:hypothetical protein
MSKLQLSTERPGKLCVAAYRVLTGDPTLLVRSCSQGLERRSVKKTIPGFDTISGGVDRTFARPFLSLIQTVLFFGSMLVARWFVRISMPGNSVRWARCFQ